MKNKQIFFFIIIFLSILCIFTVEVSAEITISQSQTLKFGTFVAGSTSGTITIYPDGSTEYNDLRYFEGNAQRAIFSIKGDPNSSYNINLPANNTVQLTDDNNHSMYVNDFSSTPSETGSLNSNGNQTLKIGATLLIKANQPSGSYSGTYYVTVSYQ